MRRVSNWGFVTAKPIRHPYKLSLSERELADLLGAIMALKQLMGEIPGEDGLDKLIERMQDCLSTPVPP